MVNKKAKIDIGKMKLFLSCLTVIIVDQITKLIIKTYLELGQSILITSFFSIQYATNTGAAFSLFSDKNSILLWLSIIFIGFIIYNYEEFSKYPIFSGLILGGAIGNLIDRIIYGKVTDFINFSFWPNFNIADSCITIGVVGLVISYWIKEKKD